MGLGSVVMVEDLNGQASPYEIEEYEDGMGRRRVRLRRRTGRRRRIGRMGPGKHNTMSRTYILPDGSKVCASPVDMIHISDEPTFDTVFLTDLSTWPAEQVFFNTRTRGENGDQVTSILAPGQVNYDIDVESVAVSFHPLEGPTKAINRALMTFFEVLQRAAVVLGIQEKTNYLFTAQDCPAGGGVWKQVFTTENDMRTLAIQNGDPTKSLRRLPHPIALRMLTKFNVKIKLAAGDAAIIAALTDDPTGLPLAVRVTLKGPEGIPLIPAAAGTLTKTEGVVSAKGY
jgi:hypothetical protein